MSWIMNRPSHRGWSFVPALCLHFTKSPTLSPLSWYLSSHCLTSFSILKVAWELALCWKRPNFERGWAFGFRGKQFLHLLDYVESSCWFIYLVSVPPFHTTGRMATYLLMNWNGRNRPQFCCCGVVIFANICTKMLLKHLSLLFVCEWYGVVCECYILNCRKRLWI